MKAKRTEKNENFVRLLIVLLAVIMLAGILKGSLFFTKSNITSMLKQFPESGLLAIGIGLCMILGGIDLSVVGIANLTAMVSALLMTRQIPENAPAEVVMGWIILICIAAVLTGLACGAFNGFCIAKLGIPANFDHTGNTAIVYRDYHCNLQWKICERSAIFIF